MTEESDIPWKVGGEYYTEGGYKARVFAIFPDQDYAIIGAFYLRGAWASMQWLRDGKSRKISGDVDDLDLVPPEKPRIKGEAWIVIAGKGSVIGAFDRRGDAMMVRGNNTDVAIKRVVFDLAEGEVQE